MTTTFAFLCGFVCASLIFGAVACVLYLKALRRVRTMQRYMKADADQIIHAAARDIYGPHH